MRTSSMKLTSLLLSLMLASGVLAAPVPQPNSGIPGFNPPKIGSSPVEGLAPGAMGEIHDGLKGGVEPPAEETDPIATATEKAAEGDPNAAQGLYRRIVPFDKRSPDGSYIANSGVAGDAAGDYLGDEGLDAPITGLYGVGKHADAPQTDDVAAAVDNTVEGFKKNGANDVSVPPSNPTGKRTAGPPSLNHEGISGEINRAAGGAGRNGKRSPDDPVGVNALSGTAVAGETVEDVAGGKKTPGSDIAGTAASGLTRRETPVGCVNPSDLRNSANCATASTINQVDPNEVNTLGNAPKDATSGTGTGTGFAGTGGPASDIAGEAAKGVPTANDANAIAKGATKSP